MFYDIQDSKIKNYEAEFKVYLSPAEDAPFYTIYAEYSAYACEDEAYAENVKFAVFLGDDEVHPDLKDYEKMFTELEEQINKHVEENGYDIWQENMQGAADFAYDCWKDDQAERGE